jgi:hypothetical protein
MRHLFLILSGVFVSGIVTSIPAHAQLQHDLNQALRLVDETNYQCYTSKNLDACDKLQAIETTLLVWCSQGDKGACTIYNYKTKLDVLEAERSVGSKFYNND